MAIFAKSDLNAGNGTDLNIYVDAAGVGAAFAAAGSGGGANQSAGNIVGIPVATPVSPAGAPGRVRPGGVGFNTKYKASGTAPSLTPYYDVEADVWVQSTNTAAAESAAVYGHGLAADCSGYAAGILNNTAQNGTATLQLWRMTAARDTNAVLGTVAITTTAATTRHIKLAFRAPQSGNSNDVRVLVFLDGAATPLIDYTDVNPGASYVATGLVGVWMKSANPNNGIGVHALNFVAAENFLFTAAPTAVYVGQGNQTISISGSFTTWSVAANTPVFTLQNTGSGPTLTNASIVSRVVTGTASAQLVINPGTVAGPITITDPSTGAILSLVVAAGATTVQLTGPSTALAGQTAPVPVALSLAPVGAGVWGAVAWQLSDGSDGLLDPSVLTLETGAVKAVSLYTPGSAGTKQLTAVQLAGGPTLTPPAAWPVPVAVPGATYTAIPAGGGAGTVGTPLLLTIALSPVGGALPSNVAIVPHEDSGDGVFSPGAASLGPGVLSTTVAYIPASAGTKHITFTNDGGLANAAPLTIVVTQRADITLAAPRTGPAGYPSSPITVALRDPASLVGSVTVHLAATLVSSGDPGGTFDQNDFALTTSTPSRTVTLTPTAGIPAPGAVPADVQISVVSSRAELVTPLPLIYAVFDPTTYGVVSGLALYGAAFTGQAATIGLTAWNDASTEAIAHTTRYTMELGATGCYLAIFPYPLRQGGAFLFDPAAGLQEGYGQAFGPQAVSAILTPADQPALEAAVAAALEGAGLTGEDITSLEEAMASQQGMMRFTFYMVTNSQQDAAGNVIVRNSSDQVIANMAGHDINTLLQTMLAGTFTVQPGTQ